MPARIVATLLPILLLQAADPPAVDELVARFQQRLGELQALRAHFSQVFHSETLGPTPPEEGTLYVKFPGQMRWEYSKPKNKLAVLDGENTYLYLPEEGRVIIGRWEELLEGSPAALLLVGELTIEDEFVVELVAEGPGLRRGLDRLRLVPREPGTRIEYLLVDLDRGGTRLRAIQMVDPIGNRVEYRFDSIRENVSLSNDLFRFDPPEGVIVEGAPAPADPG